jgi:integrase
LSPQSKKNFIGRITGLFNFGIKRGYLDKGKNPCDDITVKVKAGKKPIYTVDELQAVLNHSSPQILPLVAIGAFAGVRTQERIRLTWEDLDIRRGVLTVGEEDSKTASRRTIVMEPNLKAWLLPFQGLTGRIYHGHVNSFLVELRQTCKAAGLAKVPKNGLRHSFASYHVGKYDNAEKVRAALGHSTAALLYSNYRELVSPEEAERYFNIFPPAQPGNIVTLFA